MSAPTLRERRGTLPGGVPVPWGTVTALAVLMSFADGFWIISLREAAGAAIRTGRPFVSWLIDCTVVLPLFVLAVLAAFALAHQRYGPVLRSARTVVMTALLIALAGTVAALVVGAASAGYDYYLQAGQAEFVAATHGHTGAVSPSDPTCTGSCAVERATLEVHALGLAYSVPLQLATNVVLVGWVVALSGGRLGGRRREPGHGLLTGRHGAAGHRLAAPRRRQRRRAPHDVRTRASSSASERPELEDRVR